MREELWIKHDLRSRDDLKMMGFFREHGAFGYGIFWILVEQLSYENDNRILLSSKNLANLALLALATPAQVASIIKSSIEHELFRCTDNMLSSPRIDRYMTEKAASKISVSEARRAAGRKGLEKRYNKSAGVTSKSQQSLAKSGKPSQTDRQTDPSKALAPGSVPAPRAKPKTMLQVIRAMAESGKALDDALGVIPRKFHAWIEKQSWEVLADPKFSLLAEDSAEFDAIEAGNTQTPQPPTENAPISEMRPSS